VGAVRDSIRAVQREDWRRALSDLWYRYQGGQFWVGGYYWGSPAYVSFFQDVTGLELPGDMGERARAYQATAESACWWWPHKDFVIACDRPEVISRDERGRLHSEDGPSIRFRDGWQLQHWHGTRVDRRVIEAPESFTAEEIRAERNSEVSRALAEKLGWPRYLAAMGAVTIDTWTDDRTGLAYELLDLAERRGENQPRWLRMQSPRLNDGTSPTYVEPVHPECRTARAARRWQFRLPNGEWPTPAQANRNPELVFIQEA